MIKVPQNPHKCIFEDDTMKYTQFMQEMQKKREARSLSGQEIIALTLVIAAFAYIIFGLINNTEADYYEAGYSLPYSESYYSTESAIDESYEIHNESSDTT